MEEREAPPLEQREQLIADMVPIDPSVYSVGPNASIPEESFDESDDVRSWEGAQRIFPLTMPMIHLWHPLNCRSQRSLNPMITD